MTSTRPSQLNAVAEVQEVLRPLESSSRRETPPSTTPVLAAETEASGSGATLQDISFRIIPLTCRFLVVVRFEWRFFWSLFFLCFFSQLLVFIEFSKRSGFPLFGNTCLVIYSFDTLVPVKGLIMLFI